MGNAVPFFNILSAFFSILVFHEGKQKRRSSYSGPCIGDVVQHATFMYSDGMSPKHSWHIGKPWWMKRSPNERSLIKNNAKCLRSPKNNIAD